MMEKCVGGLENKFSDFWNNICHRAMQHIENKRLVDRRGDFCIMTFDGYLFSSGDQNEKENEG